jgi:translation initiation factor 5
MGAQTKFDKKTGTSIVNGAHDAKALAEKLEGFIKKYVQCYSCGNPETVVKIKREDILLKCKACGFVSEVDPRLKLNTFIVKNPPEEKLSKGEKKVKKAEKERLRGLDVEAPAEGGEKKEKKEKREKKDKKKSSKKSLREGEEGDDGEEAGDEPSASGGGGAEEDEDDDDDEVVWMTDTSDAAMAARAAEQLSAATAALVAQGNIEAEAKEKRRAERAAAEAEAEAARLAAEAEEKLSLSEPEAALRAAVAAGAGPDAVAAAARAVEGGPAQRARALWAALFGAAAAGAPEARLAPLVAAAAPLLAPHAADAAGQLAQLVACEHLLGVAAPGRVKEAPLVLKALYDADLAEEALVAAWAAKADAGAALGVPPAVGAAVRAAAAPFLEWLAEAESEEEEESGSEEEEEEEEESEGEE